MYDHESDSGNDLLVVRHASAFQAWQFNNKKTGMSTTVEVIIVARRFLWNYVLSVSLLIKVAVEDGNKVKVIGGEGVFSLKTSVYPMDASENLLRRIYIPLLSHNLLSVAKHVILAAEHLTKLNEGLAQKFENYQRHGFLGMKLLINEMEVDTLLEATTIYINS